MTANVFWQPISRKKNNLPVGAPSAFRKCMENAFGELPDDGWKLDKRHLETLQGMLAMTNDRSGDKNPYIQIINAIQTHSRIQIWLEY